MNYRVKVDGDRWMRADAAGAIFRMRAVGMPAGGIDIYGRTIEEQWARWRAYLRGGNLAAYPNENAPHVKGIAFDSQTTRNGKYTPSEAHKWLTVGGTGSDVSATERIRANDYGFKRTVNRGSYRERWHFAYNRAWDKKRAADLKARLKALGYLSVRDFQKAHGLTVDGVDGPQTWYHLLTNPKPAKPTTLDVKVKVVSYNAQLKRWGGGPYPKDAAFVKKLGPSVLLGQEMEEDCRDDMVDVTGFKVWALKTLGLFWDLAKYSHGARIELDFDTPYHGMIASPLTRVENQKTVVYGTVHVRANAAIPGTGDTDMEGKLSDVREVIEKLAPYPDVVVGGDWNTSKAVPLMLAAGYRLVTPAEDTVDTEGFQHFDAVFAKGDVEDRTGGSIVPSPESDHHAAVANLTVKKEGVPTT